MSDEKEKRIFSNNLNYYMKKNGKTQADIVIDLGINKSTISTWCNGTKMPRMGTVQILADYFKIKKSDLVEERNVLPEGAFPYIPRAMVQIPLVGSINCGIPLFAESNIEEYIETPVEDISRGDTYFWLRAMGDSMINVGIRKGDLLLIRKQNDVDSGDIAVVCVDNESATLKKIIKKENAIILQPENSAYEPQIYVGKEIEHINIQGRLMQARKNF